MCNAIIGLRKMGISSGLALQEAAPHAQRVGHDPDPTRAREALRREAADRTDWNPPGTCEGADRVLVALPQAEIEQTLQAIAPALAGGTLAMDTAELKAQVMAWARQHLPPATPFVGGPAIPWPDAREKPTADLFQDALFCLTPPAASPAWAAEAAAGLAQRVDARPLCMDPFEHDGWMAALKQLPALPGAALLTMWSAALAWREPPQAIGGRFARITADLPDAPNARLAAAANRQSLLYGPDRLMETLEGLRGALASAEGEAGLEKLFRAAAQTRSDWPKPRREGWGGPSVPIDGAGPPETPPGLHRLRPARKR